MNTRQFSKRFWKPRKKKYQKIRFHCRYNILHDRYNILKMILLHIKVFSIKDTLAHGAYFADKESVLLIRAYILSSSAPSHFLPNFFNYNFFCYWETDVKHFWLLILNHLSISSKCHVRNYWWAQMTELQAKVIMNGIFARVECKHVLRG